MCCAAVYDHGERSRSGRGPHLCPDAGPARPGPGGVVEGAENDRGGGVGLRSQRPGDGGASSLHQQPGAGGQVFCPSSSWPLGDREQLPLESRLYLPRGRVPHPGEKPAGELRLAEPLCFVAAQTEPRSRQCRHETPRVWLERRLHVASANRGNALVAAGPGWTLPCFFERFVATASK